jgi:hypothetical protein
MSSSPSIPRFLTGVLAALAFCFGMQGVAYYKLNAGAIKAESNYYSSLGRIQKARAPSASLALIGSSITGRLPGREAGNNDVANLGADGGSPLDGMELLVDGVIAQPQWLVVETNTLFNQIGYARIPLVAGAKGSWFRIGANFPLVGASARPSGMLYSRILNRSQPATAEPFPVNLTSPLAGHGGELSLASLSPAQFERLRTLESGLKSLKHRGVRLLFVNYPAGQMAAREQNLMLTAVLHLSRETGSAFLDLAGQIDRTELTFTDPVHLGPESAARILKTMQVACGPFE